jgi:RHS repeat-associated protein
MRYTAFGETRLSSGQAETEHKYTGQLSMGIGLYFYQSRMYDPYLNHWTQPDTIIPDPYNPQDWDRYSYVSNNSVNRTDPSGHKACDDWGNDGRCTIFAPSRVLTPAQIMLGLLKKNSPTANGANLTTKVGDPNTMRTTTNMSAEQVQDYVGKNGIHPGVDLNYGVNSEGGNLYAIADGTVVYVGEPANGSAPGYIIVIKHTVEGVNYYSVYFHISTDTNLGTPLSVGTQVKAGDVVAQMGRSGTNEVHLHFEVRRETTVNSNGMPISYWPKTRNEFNSGWLDISPIFGGMGYGWGYLK